MNNKTKLQTIGTAVLLSIMLTGCAEGNGQSDDPNAYAKITYSYSDLNANESTPVEESSAVAINGDVMWGLGKTVNEVTEKYGSANGNVQFYTFENGYGKYVFKNGCNTIGDIPAKDFLVSDLSAVTLDNIAEKCGFEIVPLNDTGVSETMYEGYRTAYYTHPNYKNVSFMMFYNENGFDETASFKVTLDSEIPAITDEFVNTLNSVIDSAADVEALKSGIKSADIGELTAEVRVFEHPDAFENNTLYTDGELKDGAVILVELSDGSCYITVRGERTTDPVPMQEMLAHIVQRADTIEQLKAELDGYARGGSDKAASRVAIYRDGEAMVAGSDVGKTIIENGEIVGTDDDLKNGGTVGRVEYNGGEGYIDFSLTES